MHVDGVFTGHDIVERRSLLGGLYVSAPSRNHPVVVQVLCEDVERQTVAVPSFPQTIPLDRRVLFAKRATSGQPSHSEHQGSTHDRRCFLHSCHPLHPPSWLRRLNAHPSSLANDDPTRTAAALKLTFFSLVGAYSQLCPPTQSSNSSVHPPYSLGRCKFSPPTMPTCSVNPPIRSIISPLCRAECAGRNSPFLTRLTDT